MDLFYNGRKEKGRLFAWFRIPWWNRPLERRIDDVPYKNVKPMAEHTPTT